MQIDYWSYLYENWFVLFGVMTTLIIILTLVIGRIAISRIGTKVFYFQKNSVDIYKAKLEKGHIAFNKMKAKRKADPYMIKFGWWQLCRIFIVDWKKKETIDFRDIEPTSEADKIMWETIIESEAITQTIRGLLETTKTILIYLAAGGFIGFLISQILFTMG